MRMNKIYSMLGLATKAGKIVSGEFSAEKETKSGRSCLVIVAEDASENTKKKFRNMCEFYQVKLAVAGTKDELGHAIGKEYRAVVAVLDAGFAKSVSAQLEASGITIE